MLVIYREIYHKMRVYNSLVTKEEQIQHDYYERTSLQYDEMHLGKDWQHDLALLLLGAYIEFHGVRSVLDVGAGTGRTLIWLKERFPNLRVAGVEPVSALRAKGYEKGLTKDELVDGTGYRLPYDNNAFDLVCEFAVLHHVRNPNMVIREMSRVASMSIAISDCSFLGQGTIVQQFLKRWLYRMGAWPIADRIKTRGKGYTISKGDGLAYSYSVYQSMPQLHCLWKTIRVTATDGASDTKFGPMSTAAHLFVFATEKLYP